MGGWVVGRAGKPKAGPQKWVVEWIGIVMSIAVPGTSFHAEIGQLIKYSPHNNSQTEALKQNPNAFVTFQCSIKWADILWWAWHIKRKSVRFSGPAPPTNTWWTSLDAHYLQTSSMHPKKEKKLESGSTFLWPGNCLKCTDDQPNSQFRHFF